MYFGGFCTCIRISGHESMENGTVFLQHCGQVVGRITAAGSSILQIEVISVERFLHFTVVAGAVDDGIETVVDTEHLFDRTYRADKSRHGTSAGLGLYIVKLLAEKQGAQVAATIENNLLEITIILNIA